MKASIEYRHSTAKPETQETGMCVEMKNGTFVSLCLQITQSVNIQYWQTRKTKVIESFCYE